MKTAGVHRTGPVDDVHFAGEPTLSRSAPKTCIIIVNLFKQPATSSDRPHIIEFHPFTADWMYAYTVHVHIYVNV